MPLAFLAVFFAYPVIAIVGRGLAPDGSLDLDPLGDVVTDAALRHIAWFTVWQATLSTVLTLAVGAPGRVRARALRVPGPARGAGARDRAVRAARRSSWRRRSSRCSARAGRSAALGLDQTVWAILVAHVFFNYAVVVRTVGGLWAHLDPRPRKRRACSARAGGVRSAR